MASPTTRPHRLNPLFIGYSSARPRFRRFFPEGFAGDHYVEMERGYKWRAKELLETSTPLDAVAAGGNFGEAVAPILRRRTFLTRGSRRQCFAPS